MSERIWVNPDGLRVKGMGHPDGYWEDDWPDGYPVNAPKATVKDIFGIPGGTPKTSLAHLVDVPKRVLPDSEPTPSIEEMYRHILEERERANRPSLWSRVKPRLVSAVKPVPCLSVWAGMVATFFWHSAQTMPEFPISSWLAIPESLDGAPEVKIAAAIQTIVFVVWSMCFRHTIRTAVRKEFEQR